MPSDLFHQINNWCGPPKFSADLWSIMCVAVEMVTGSLPWPRETDYQSAMLKVRYIAHYENIT